MEKVLFIIFAVIAVASALNILIQRNPLYSALSLIGTLAAGLVQRIANDSDTRPGICYTAYEGNGSRVGNVPLIQWIGTDRSQAQVTAFLRFFLAGPPTGSAQTTTFPVEFISDPTPTRGETWGRIKLLYR